MKRYGTCGQLPTTKKFKVQNMHENMADTRQGWRIKKYDQSRTRTNNKLYIKHVKARPTKFTVNTVHLVPVCEIKKIINLTLKIQMVYSKGR